MKRLINRWISRASKFGSDSPVLDETTVRPFGAGGVGTITGHPVGLVLSIGPILIGLFALPEAVVFVIFSIVIGSLFGFFLWLRHRNKGF